MPVVAAYLVSQIQSKKAKFCIIAEEILVTQFTQIFSWVLFELDSSIQESPEKLYRCLVFTLSIVIIDKNRGRINNLSSSQLELGSNQLEQAVGGSALGRPDKKKNTKKQNKLTEYSYSLQAEIFFEYCQ